METVKKILERKWGAFTPEKTFFKQCSIDEDEYLNVIFKPIERSRYAYIGELLDWKIPSDLVSFYGKCNGLSFFSESIRIYGAAIDVRDTYNTLEIVRENVISKLKKTMPQYSDMIIIGSYGYYYFCVKRIFDNKFYVIGANEKKVVYLFDGIEKLLNFYVGKLVEEYDKDGIKIHKDNDMVGTPMENTSYESL